MPGSLRLRENSSLRGSANGRPREEDQLSERSHYNGSVGGTAGGASLNSNSANANPWALTLHMRGIVVVWCAWGGTLLVAFFLGSSLGQHQGLQSALEEYGQEGVRENIPGFVRKEPVLALDSGAGRQSRLLTENVIAPEASALQMTPVPQTINALQAPNGVAQIPAVPAASQAQAPAIQVGWVVQAATLRSHAEAEKILKKFQHLKIPALIEQKSAGSYFRVVLGPFPTQEKANQAKKQAIRTKTVRGELYVKQLTPQ